MAQLSNYGEALDAEPIQKNRTSSKNQKSRGNFLRKLCFPVLTVFLFCTCEKQPEREAEITDEMLGSWYLQGIEYNIQVDDEGHVANVKHTVKDYRETMFTLHNNKTYTGNIEAPYLSCNGDDNAPNTWKLLDNGLFSYSTDDGCIISVRATFSDSELILDNTIFEIPAYDIYRKFIYAREPVQFPSLPAPDDIVPFKGDPSILYGTWCATIDDSFAYDDEGNERYFVDWQVYNYKANDEVVKLIANSDGSFILWDKTFTFDPSSGTMTSNEDKDLKYTIEATSNESTLIISHFFGEKNDFLGFGRLTFTKKN